MKMKRIVIVALVIVAVLLSAAVVSAGFLEDLFGVQHKDNVVEIENIKFNTTNVTSFKLSNETNVSGVHASAYVDDKDTGYNVHIINCSGIESNAATDFIQDYLTKFDKSPSQTISGAVIYTISADSGSHAGQPRYVGYVQNKDLKTLVEISSPDANETSKMIRSLTFK
ncbi:MAG: hypothetical protein Q4Q18_09410 [Methanobrevibacter sp.]|nr:hypothetical protein [Methanobrevibacter sp.]